MAHVQIESSGALQGQPILRWAGSKKRSLPDILAFVPPIRGRYIEVFAGSACLFFAIEPKRAVISDNNVDLMHFYRELSAHPRAIYRRFVALPRRRSVYNQMRKRDPSELTDIDRAVRFLFLNRNCFNGIFRTNISGQFNVPFSDSRVPRYPEYQAVQASAEALAGASLHCDDFENVCLREVRAHDFVYLDPPYYVPAKRIFREYSSKPFAESDTKRLANVLREIDQRGARFLLSYPECAMIRRLANQWKTNVISVRRTVAGRLASRGYSPELLISNFDAQPRR